MTEIGAAQYGFAQTNRSNVRWIYVRASLGVAKSVLRNPLGFVSVAILTLLFAFAFLGPSFYRDSPDEISVSYLSSPSLDRPAGTDTLGRDTLARLMDGGRISFIVAVCSGLLGLAIAFPLGVWSGYSRGIVDNVLMRIMDTIYAFPTILLTLGLVAVLGRGLDKIIIAIAIWGIPGIARLVRAQALAVRETDYILAARAVGASQLRILVSHVSRNVVSPAIIQVTVVMSGAVLLEASLGFLGTGVPAPQATWGGMLLEAFPLMRIAPAQTFIPGAFIFLLVFALNVLGDVVRDVLDPRLKGE
ncbi:MAG: ABC transporter permease [Dehalococcoidia bacterium]|nr:ABC transporter permease [Dehalococcoidia bacterium]